MSNCSCNTAKIPLQQFRGRWQNMHIEAVISKWDFGRDIIWRINFDLMMLFAEVKHVLANFSNDKVIYFDYKYLQWTFILLLSRGGQTLILMKVTPYTTTNWFQLQMGNTCFLWIQTRDPSGFGNTAYPVNSPALYLLSNWEISKITCTVGLHMHARHPPRHHYTGQMVSGWVPSTHMQNNWACFVCLSGWEGKVLDSSSSRWCCKRLFLH